MQLAPEYTDFGYLARNTLLMITTSYSLNIVLVIVAIFLYT